MWLQRYTNYLLQHRLVALVFTFLVTFIPVVGVLGILIAAMVTLVKGIVEGAIFTLAASLPFVISFYFSSGQEATVPLFVWAAVGVAVASNVLTWVFAGMLYRHASWSLILQVAALLGVLVISVVHLIYPDVVDWWGGQLESYYHQITNAATQTAQPSSPEITANETQLESIRMTKYYATGLMMTGVLFNALLQLMIARWWQGLIHKARLLRNGLHFIRLSQLAGGLFVVSLGLWYWGNEVVLDMMPVLCLLFAAAGLSLIHYLFGLMQSSTAWFWLLLFYVSLLFALPTSLLLIGFVGLFDVWFDIRKRIRKV
jgi:hypothetical protein